MIAPALVYISQPTEYGTLYSRRSSRELSAVCRERDLNSCFIDGARLPTRWPRPPTIVTLADLSTPHRCLLHRRHQVRLSVRRGRGHPRAWLDPPVRHSDEAAWRAPGEGAPPRRAVRGALRGRPLLTIGEPAVTATARIREALKRAGYVVTMDSPTNLTFVALRIRPGMSACRIRCATASGRPCPMAATSRASAPRGRPRGGRGGLR